MPKACINAEMTAGPGSNPIKNFQDVIDRDINVVARHSTSNHEVLKTAVEGTPMYNYYYDTMHDDPNMFVKVCRGYGCYEQS